MTPGVWFFLATGEIFTLIILSDFLDDFRQDREPEVARLLVLGFLLGWLLFWPLALGLVMHYVIMRGVVRPSVRFIRGLYIVPTILREAVRLERKPALSPPRDAPVAGQVSIAPTAGAVSTTRE